MKKRIGTKVVILLSILTTFFVVFCVCNIFALSEIGRRNAEVTDVCLKLEEVKGEVFACAQEYSDNMEISKAHVRGKDLMLQNTAEIRGYFDEMAVLCQQTGDTALIDSFTAYRNEYEAYMVVGDQLAEAVDQGDSLTGMLLIGENRKKLNAIEETKTAFAAALENRVDYIASKIDSKINGTYVFNVIVTVIFLLMVLAANFIVSRTIAKPAKTASGHLSQIVKKLQNNEGDLTERIEVRTQDEVGQLAGGVNSFIEQLQGLMQKLKGQSERMMDSVDHITDRVNTSNEDITNVSAAMEELAASMQEVSASLDQIVEGSNDIFEKIKTMAEQAEDGAGLVEEIKERAHTVRKHTVDNKTAINQKMSGIRATLQGAVEESKSVEQINELTGDILDISSQTNLLALNASIEAARAGDAGRGFAVVADEIRVLADNSRDTANHIQDISHMVTSAVEKLAQNAEEMLKFIDENVVKDYDGFVDIANCYQKDAENVDDILTNFAGSTAEVENIMERINSSITNVSGTVDDSTKGISNAAENAENLVEAISHIQQETENNQIISRELRDEVERFKKV